MQGVLGFLFHLTANLPRNLLVKKNFNWLRIDRIVVMSLAPFLAHPVYQLVAYTCIKRVWISAMTKVFKMLKIR